MNNSSSGSKASLPDVVAITANSRETTGFSDSPESSNTRKSADSNGRKRGSDCKRRKRSHRKGGRSSHKESGHRQRSKHSPRRSSSHSGGSFSAGSAELLSSDDGHAIARTSRASRSSRGTPRRCKTSVSPQSFYDDDDVDAEPRSKRFEDFPTLNKGSNKGSKGSITTSYSTGDLATTAKLFKRSRKRGSEDSLTLTKGSLTSSQSTGDLVTTAKTSKRSWNSRSSGSSKLSAGAQSRSSSKSLKRGIEPDRSSGHSKSTSSTARRTAILYGDTHGIRAKAKASRDSGSKRSHKPGMERVSLPGQSKSTANSSRTTQILYGDADTKSKAKSVLGASSHHSKKSSGSKSTTETLYGDADVKAKAKAMHGSSSIYSKRSSSTKTGTIEILYGNYADAKAKATKSSRRSRRNEDPGVEHVEHVEHTTDDTESESRSLGSSRPQPSASMPVEGSSSPITAKGSVVVASKKKQKSKQKTKSCYTKWILLVCVIVVIGGGVTAFLALRKDNDDQDAKVQVADIHNSTTPSKVPTGVPNSTPTKSPSAKWMLDPPSSEECAAIEKNETLLGSNNIFSQVNWIVNIQINVKGETKMTDSNVAELMDAIQEHLLPSMAGCDIHGEGKPNQRKLSNVSRPVIRGAHRELEVPIDESRFAILFAYAKGSWQEDSVCVDTVTPKLCYIVQVEFVLYLDSEISSAALEAIIMEELEGGNSIVSKLDLGDLFLSANAKSIRNVNPSGAPTASPTDAPSRSPSTSSTKPPFGVPVAEPTDGPVIYTSAPVEEPTNVPVSLTQAPMAEPTLVPKTPSATPFDAPTSVPNESPSPSAFPTEVPSSFPSKMPSTSIPVLGPSPPPTVLPTVLGSSFPSAVPSTVPSTFPTVSSSPAPSGTPTADATVNSSSPSIPSPSSTPSGAPSTNPSQYPSHVPSPAPSRFPTPLPTSAATSQCSCIDGDSGSACDGSEANIFIGCGSCIGTSSCFRLRDNLFYPNVIGTIGDNSCKQLGACDNAMVISIGNGSCTMEYSCSWRYIEAGSRSCSAPFACASNSGNPYGKLVVADDSCSGEYSCFSQEISLESNSCKQGWSCAGRQKIYVADSACTGQNSCSGTVFNSGNIYIAQGQTSFFGQGSCICEKCCVCMIRVASGRCTTPGECCTVNNPSLKAPGVQDNTEAEMRQDFGVSDLNILFLGSN